MRTKGIVFYSHFTDTYNISHIGSNLY